jgi:sec-independent protein translocase protein TatB
MSLPDTIFILLAALVLFGPKKLPEIARQAGKLLAELRRASNEFKFQMEEELRQSDEAERRAKAEAAAVAAPATTESSPIVSTLIIQPPATGAPIVNRISPRAESEPVPETADRHEPQSETEAAPHA